jgi:hypothetical protein
MEEAIFSEKKIENSDEKPVFEKTKKIVFDYDQLDYIKFRLNFMDGFNFGLGLITSIILVNLIIFLFLIIVGFSFSDLISKFFSDLFLKSLM